MFDLKEVDATLYSYKLLSKIDVTKNGSVRGGSTGFPKYGLLMNILGMIFMEGNCTMEQNVWEFVNKTRTYARKRHIFQRSSSPKIS